MELSNLHTQKLEHGYGPTYHRVYAITLSLTESEARQAMNELKADLNRFSPQLLARFEKTKGESKKLQKGDEFQIHITGPWDGPVRVESVDEWSFLLKTLEGHLEAGQIRFEMKKKDEQHFIFEIESLARSRDAVVNLVYDKIPIAKLAQTEMWTSFCKNLSDVVNHLIQNQNYSCSDVSVLTERQDEKTGQWETI